MSSRALPTILLVDDEPHSLSSMRMALEDDFAVLEAPCARDALALMDEHWVQVVISDQRIPGTTGIEMLTEMRDRWPETVRIIVTGYTETDDMIEAINAAGIYQFIPKPWHPDQLLMAVRNAARLFELARDHERMTLEMRYLGSSASAKLEEQRRALQEGLGFDKLLRGPGSSLNGVIALARQYASFDVPVLITGEAGTGKGDLARAIHYGSLRADRPFHELNCAGLSDEALAAALFGVRRGGLPGVQATQVGLLEKAHGGTLFLNGVDTLSPSLQMAVVRLIKEGAFHPIGGHEVVRSDARILTGAHRDLAQCVADGAFRGDLYYALCVTELQMPPLRGRPGDIARLAERLLHDAAEEHGKPVRGFSDAALTFLENYDWPGNLAELRNEVTRMLIMAQDVTLGPDLISRHILQAEPGDGGADRRAMDVGTMDGTLKDRVETMEMRVLRETLTRLKWNKSRAAGELGLSRVGLRAKLERYGITPHAVALQQE